jgi:predicted nucleic acid-binding protein
MLDSDILIWILRDNPDYKDLFRKAAARASGRLYLTPVQVMEIQTGVRDRERINTDLFLDSFLMVNLDRETGRLAGLFLREYRKSHQLHGADALIAAAVKRQDLKLWTNNRKHYPMLAEGEFWDSPPPTPFFQL